MKGSATAACGLPRRVVLERRVGDPADGRPVEVAADLVLELGNAKVGALPAGLDEQLLDALVVPLVPVAAGAGGLNRLLEVVHHVAHALIIGDWQSRCQVMRGNSLTQA